MESENEIHSKFLLSPCFNNHRLALSKLSASLWLCNIPYIT